MIAQEDIRILPMAEKLRLMETLWEEISSGPEHLQVPQWHKDLLDERSRALEEGRETVLEWDDAKAQIFAATR